MVSEDMATATQEERSSEIRVNGAPLQTLPHDLFIPPDALRVFLDTFEGPLDLLLYLIRKQNIDILDIPITSITKQYVAYVDLMREMQFELAAEYLVMAAMLAEIKSRLLLPTPAAAPEDEELDPRAELVRRLQEYERYKQAAESIDAMPHVGRDTWVAAADLPTQSDVPVPKPAVSLDALLDALQAVMRRVALHTDHTIQRETLSIRARMTEVLSAIRPNECIEFTQLFTVDEGRMGVVVTLIAILELVRQHVLSCVQAEPGAQIYIQARCES